MATAPDINDVNKQIEDARKQLGLTPMAPFDIANLKLAQSELKALQASLREMGSDLDYIHKSFRDSVNELSKQGNVLAVVRSSLKGISDISSKLVDYRKGELDLSRKDLENLKYKAKKQWEILETSKTNIKLSIAQRAEIESSLESQQIFIEGLKEIEELHHKINANSGVELFGGMSDLISSLPGLRKLAEPFQDAAKAAKDAAREKILTGEGPSAMMAGLKSLGPALAKAFGPLALMTMFIEGLNQADKETTELKKSMVLNTSESVNFRYNMVEAANASENINITATKLLETFSSLNKQFGYITNFANSTLVTATKLTNIVGVAGESTNNLAAASELNGLNFESAYKSSIGTSYELQRQAGVQFDLRDILTESGKITGQIRANLGANPIKLAEAVTQAKIFGASLQEVNAAGKSFLDFESSISNELQAELLLGKDLNLEKARTAALNGDQVGLAKELTKQAGSFSEYSKMNVLQQESLAAAIGMQADQLSDILFKQAVQGKNAKELRALGEDELAQRLESQTLADKFSATMDKLKAIVTDLATVFMPVLNIVGGILSALAAWPPLLQGISLLMTGIAARSIAIAAANALGYSAMAGPVGVVAGLAAMVGADVYLNSLNDKVNSAGDIISPANGHTQISTKEGGLFNLSRNDDVIAAPGLANKINNSGGTNMSETNMLLRQILTKQGTVQIDNTKIGTAFAMNTYEIQ